MAGAASDVRDRVLTVPNALSVLRLVLLPAPAFAWGSAAHRYITRRAIELLPSEVKPFFLHFADELILRRLSNGGLEKGKSPRNFAQAFRAPLCSLTGCVCWWSMTSITFGAH